MSTRNIDEGVVGFLGGGRLASAIVERYAASEWGGRIIAWSRGGPGKSREPALNASFVQWVEEWHKVLEADCVFVAMPGTPLLRMASAHRGSADCFKGRLYCTSMDLRITELHQAFPRAVCVRVAPFLLPGLDSIPSVALRPAVIEDDEWQQIEEELKQLGELDVVVDEAVFERLAIVGSPWPVVVTDCLVRVLESTVRSGIHEGEIDVLSARIFWRALMSLGAAEQSGSAITKTSEKIATPGGLTERGLREAPIAARALARVFDGMLARQHELVDGTGLQEG